MPRYQFDPTLGDRVFDLLDLAFPGVRAARANGEAFGSRWEAASTPFVIEDAGRVISHVGLIPMPLWVMGAPLWSGGIHGVATHPNCRRRGYFRSALEAALTAAEGRFNTLLLTTLHREYFEPFGFRVVPESVFRFRPPGPVPAVPSRLVDLGRPDDLRMMHRLLADRAPVSDVLGVGPETASWAFYECQSPIRYLPSRDAAVIGHLADGVLRLYDVIGPAIPPIDAIIGAFGAPIGEVVCYLTPDRLGAGFAAEPHDLTGGPEALEPGSPDLVFMVKGPFPAEGRPLMLPRPARC